MTQPDFGTLRDALTPHTITDHQLDLIMAAVEAYVAPIIAERDAARIEVAWVRLAWKSARRRATRHKSLAALRADVRDLLQAQLDTACAELASEAARVTAARGEADRARIERDQAVADAAQAARSMRDRADQAIQSAWPRLADRRTPAEQCGQVVRAVRALPLLADPDRPDAPDEVPTLAELADRMAAVEQALAAPAGPARCASTMYTQTGAVLARCTHPADHDGRHVNQPFGWDDATSARTRPATCEVCGLAAADQEHGVDGRCRHTPATLP